MRFRRRPSPKRRNLSKSSFPATGLEYRPLDFPPSAVEAPRTNRVVAGSLQNGDRSEASQSVHRQSSLLPALGELELVARLARQLDDLDPARCDGPDALRLAGRLGAVRRLDRN